MAEPTQEFHSIHPDQPLSISALADIITSGKKLLLSEDARKRIVVCYDYLQDKINGSEVTYYGINTGFGSLADIKIPRDDLQKLQENLIRSHACGVGDFVDQEIVRLMLLLKIQSLSYGHSGVQPQTVERLIYFYNNALYPEVYDHGSLGASGDLAPLAHLCLPLIGEGFFRISGISVPAADILHQHKLEPLQLSAKEGLALLNGTQFMSAYGAYILIQSDRLIEHAFHIAALSTDAWDCRMEPFLPYIHQIRPHAGQMQAAHKMLTLLTGSQMIARPKKHTQDPYSFRCIPQVMGACLGAIAHVREVFETEINSVTDNPNIFPEQDLILSGGNFHGEALALALDYLCLALSELGSISERRTYNMISGKRGLPEFLVSNPGLNSGLMIPQYVAAGLVSENKQLSTPSSVDSIPSSNGQEDHVSMGANGAVKALRVLDNLRRILAIELLNAAQAMEFLRPLKTSPALELYLADYRNRVEKLDEDRYLSQDINASIVFLQLDVINPVLT